MKSKSCTFTWDLLVSNAWEKKSIVILVPICHIIKTSRNYNILTTKNFFSILHLHFVRLQKNCCTHFVRELCGVVVGCRFSLLKIKREEWGQRRKDGIVFAFSFSFGFFCSPLSFSVSLILKLLSLLTPLNASVVLFSRLSWPSRIWRQRGICSNLTLNRENKIYT